MKRIGIFWDYENCPTPVRMSGYTVAGNIRRAAAALGDEISIFKAYVDVHLESTSKKEQQAELQASGVTLVHCPHASRKEVADRVLLVDLLVFALECKDPASIVLISGDRDFTYAISTLRMKGHDVYVIFPSEQSAHHGLKHLANGVLAWKTVLQSEVITLGFAGMNPNERRATTDAIPSRNLEQLRLQGPASTPPRLLARFSFPGKHTATTPLSAMLGTRIAHSPTGCTIMTDMPKDSAMLSNERAQTRSNLRHFLSSIASIGAGKDGQAREILMVPTQTLASRCLSSSLNSALAKGLPGSATLVDQSGLSSSEAQIKCGALPAALRSVPLSQTPSTSPGKVSQCKEAKALSGAISSASRPFVGTEAFLVLVQILLRERANGHKSTPCDILDGFLRRARPTIYQDIGVPGLKEYLKIAQNAGIILYSDILWENHRGWVSLRNPQTYCTVQGGSGTTLGLPGGRETANSKSSRRRKAKAGSSSGADTGVQAKGKNGEPSQAVGVQQTQADKGNRFALLIGIMRDFRSKGIKRVRAADLYKPLQQSGTGHVMNRSELRIFIAFARTSGILIGGKDTNDFAELHSDYY